MNPRKLVRLLLVTRNLRTALHAWRNGIEWMQLEKRDKRIVIKGTNIPCEQLPSPLPEAFYWNVTFLANFGFKLDAASHDGKNSILADTGQVKLWLDRDDAIAVVEEVFGNLEYGAVLSEPAIVIDIGMNVATAALYFAKEQTVKRVIGFEPYFESIQRAERNLALNPEIGQKIDIRRYALGKTNGIAYLQVDPKRSIENKITCGSDSKEGSSETVAVEIRDAETELQSVLASADEGSRVILKVDCEGSEREVFQSLSPDTLSRIDVILMEWHHADILKEIIQKLQELAFRLLVRRSGEMNTGMLYAFRK